ncbi:hypothetical protein NHX12_008375 [Muraenolepis orangiensis]|uniref:Ig-like domain-containing protein n=1 Tax=Muraenolepis orangiensis TaxID=630683 RepID=A0A9Q0I993_9TELE|nr:hypothetical protein NHX12_008375 [Muraenolepis orangiensis]
MYPKTRSMYPKTRSMYPKTRNMHRKTRSMYPKTRSMYRKTRSMYPKTRSMYPKTRSMYPKTRSMYRKTRSMYPKTRSMYPAAGQTVQMDSEKSGLVGSRVELRCIFVNSNPPVKISQVTWQKVNNSSKQNVAIANPALGVSVLPPFKERVSFKQAAVKLQAPSLEDTTIVFSNLQLSDDAAYICEYTTFPAGNRENMVNLSVFARPVTRLSLTSSIIVAKGQSLKTTVATCESANGKPASVIRWETSLKGEATFQETQNANGTVTLKSSYVVAPSRDTHNKKLTCVVAYRSDFFNDSVVLNVQYEPAVTISGFDKNWYLNRPDVKLKCEVDANPPVIGLNGSMATNVEVKNDSLHFRGPVTSDLAGVYICEATNGVGTQTGSVEVNITDGFAGGVSSRDEGRTVAAFQLVDGGVFSCSADAIDHDRPLSKDVCSGDLMNLHSALINPSFQGGRIAARGGKET